MERARFLRSVSVVLLLTSGAATAQEQQREQQPEQQPVDVQMLHPLPAQSRSAHGQTEPGAAARAGLREVPFRAPVSAAALAAAKRQAASDPRVAPADQVVEPSGPTPQVPATLVRSFFGINIFQAGTVTTEDGKVFVVPSEPNVAASPQRVIHVVNGAIRMFDRSGRRIQTLDLNDFFNTGRPRNFFYLPFGPRIIFDANPDAANKRFYVTAVQGRPEVEPPNFSYIWLAVSRSANPPSLNPRHWCVYRINALRDPGTALESFAEPPSIGAGPDALVIAANQVTFSEFAFTFNVIRALNKRVLSDNTGRCPSTRLFTFLASRTVGDLRAVNLAPVQHLTNPSSFPGTRNPTYLINAIYTTGTTVPSREYRVWRLRNVATSPSLSVTTVTGNFAYFVPPNMPQRNEAGFIFTGDDRVSEAAGVRDAFWAAQATACSFPRGGNVSCVSVVRVSVGQTPGGALQASITQQRTFGSPGEFLFMPAIAVNRDETVAVPFHFASRTRTNNYAVSIWWTVKALGEGAVGPLRPLATGRCQQLVPVVGFTAGAETDPADLRSFWLTGERAREIAALGGACLWETRIGLVTPGGGSPPAMASRADAPPR